MIYYDDIKHLAISLHQETRCTYDDYGYEVHLASVVSNLMRFIHLVPHKYRKAAIATAWLHDAIEDRRWTYNDCLSALRNKGCDATEAELIADCVYSLAKPKGKNRAERLSEDYLGSIFYTNDNPMIAPVVKLCDILANMQYSKATGSGMFDKYCDEFSNVIKPYVARFPSLVPIITDIESLMRLDGRF